MAEDLLVMVAAPISAGRKGARTEAHEVMEDAGALGQTLEVATPVEEITPAAATSRVTDE